MNIKIILQNAYDSLEIMIEQAELYYEQNKNKLNNNLIRAMFSDIEDAKGSLKALSDLL